MNLYRAVALALVAIAPAPSLFGSSSTPPPDQQQVLEAARQYALGYIDKLPNFICSQITTRSQYSQQMPAATAIQSRRGVPSVISPAIPSDTGDRIVERLTYFNQNEKYTVETINGRPAPNADHMHMSGAISIGEFGTALRDVFAPSSNTEFTWHETARVHGHRVYVYQFQVPKESGIEIRDSIKDKDVVAGYSGLVYVDASTNEVLRMTSDINLPPGLSITAGNRNVDYQPVTIAGKTYTLPVRSEVTLQNGDARYVNSIEFKDYRKFGAESTIHYDDPPVTSTPQQ